MHLWKLTRRVDGSGGSMPLEVFLNDMRYINPRFTYLLTYLHVVFFWSRVRCWVRNLSNIDDRVRNISRQTLNLTQTLTLTLTRTLTLILTLTPTVTIYIHIHKHGHLGLTGCRNSVWRCYPWSPSSAWRQRKSVVRLLLQVVSVDPSTSSHVLTTYHALAQPSRCFYPLDAYVVSAQSDRSSDGIKTLSQFNSQERKFISSTSFIHQEFWLCWPSGQYLSAR